MLWADAPEAMQQKLRAHPQGNHNVPQQPGAAGQDPQ